MSRRTFEEELLEEENPRRRSRSTQNNDDDAPRRRSRWPFFLLFLLVLIFLLPNLVGWFGLQKHAIEYGLSDFKGKVTIEKISMGWVQPIVLSNISAVDENGNQLFQAETVTSSKPLYSFLTSSDYGQFDVVRPVAYVQMRPDGSNIEDAFTNYIQTADETVDPSASAEPLKPLPGMTFNLVEGLAMVTSTETGETWQLDQLNMIAETSTEEAPLKLDLQCRVTPITVDDSGQSVLQNPGGVVLVSRVDTGSELLTFGSAELLLETESLPLSLAAPLLRRAIGPAATSGLMSGKVQASYSSRSNSVAMDFERLNVNQLLVNAPQLLGSDTVSVESITAIGNLEASPSIIAAKQFNVKSDVGWVNANGQFDVNQLANLGQISNLNGGGSLLGTPFQMDGEVDLARLIRMLPSTLQLHQDLVVDSGKVNFTAASRNENGTRRMVVNVDTANLNARRGQQNISWPKPLRLVGTLQESQGRMSLEDVQCISDFLTLKGSADATTGSFVVDGDLSQLMGRVSQFVDLQGTRLAGTLDGKFGWQIDPNATQPTANSSAPLPIQIGGAFNVANPVIEMSGMPRWQPNQLSMKISATGLSQAERLQLNQGGIQVDIGDERAIASLVEPVADAYTQEVWRSNCQLTGGLANWLGHVRNFVDIGEFQADGSVNLTCSAAVNSSAIQLANIEYAVEQFGFNGYEMAIREPKVQGTGTVVYDLNTGIIAFPNATLASSAVTAGGENLQLAFAPNMRLDGNVAFKADVNRVAGWYGLSEPQETIQWFGGMEGNLELASNEHGIGAKVNANISDLVAAQQVVVQPEIPNEQGQTIRASQAQRQWQEIWREPKVGVTGMVSLANDFNAVAFQELVVDSPSLRVSTSGTIADLADAMVTNLNGTWNPDWQNLNSLLAGYTYNMVQFAGNGQRPFTLQGPLFATAAESPQPGMEPWISSNLRATTNIGWDAGQVAGLPVGKSQIDIDVQQGIAFLQTQGIPFAGGIIQFAPQLDMRGDSPVARLERTRIIDNVELKPETARQWLKYVAPLAADATSAQGNFTVDIGSAAVPVLDPMKMEANGAVHLSNVVIGAGPTAEQLLATVKQLRALLKPEAQDRDMRTWLTMSEQTVPIAVQNGRVFHEKLKFSHKDLVVQTGGSVGLDQTLDMMAQIPIHDDWIADKPYLASLKGQSISIPIGGTVSKPVLDRRSLQQLSQNLLKQAASGAINKAIGDKLAPKVNEFQNDVTNKLNGELNKFQNKVGEKIGEQLGDSLFGNPENQGTQPGQNLQDQIGNKLEQELKKGIGKLFKK